MDKKTSQRAGSGTVLKLLLYAALLLEIFWFVNETQGDLANGLLFFVSDQLQPVVILFYAVLFISGYFLGRRAGNQIIMQGKNHLTIGVLSGLLQSLILVLYLIGMSAARRVLNDALDHLLQIVLFITIPTVLIWLLACYLISKKRTPAQ